MTAPKRITCDVLVAGSGAGGFAAALTASHHGLEVIVTEKEALFGGTTAYAVGGIWMPGNVQARRAGIDDSAELAFTYLEHKVGSRLNREKALAYVHNCAAMLEFFERHTEMRYALQKRPDYHPELPGAVAQGRSMLPEPFDGRLLGEYFAKLRPPLSSTMLLGGLGVNPNDVMHLFNATRSLGSARHVARLLGRYALDRLGHSRGTRLVNGNALIGRLARSLLERRIPLWLSAPITKIEHHDGRVVGAHVDRSGTSVEITTRRGVVLACGGFAASDAMRRRYFPHVGAGRNHASMASPGNTGDGIRLATEVGANFIEDAWHPAAWAPVSLAPQADGTRVPFPHFMDRCKPGYIAVARTGRRFANEAQSYHDFVPAMIEACRSQPETEAYLVCDHRAIRRYGLGVAPPAPARLEPHCRSGYLTRAESPDALARLLGIDADAFAATVARYNEGALRGDDPEFGKGRNAYDRFVGDQRHQPNPCVAPLSTPPFYAVRLVPSDLGTFIGLATDRFARALDQAGNPIEGLYAVGNDQASAMGGTYPGAGIMLGTALTFGYLAGLHLAEGARSALR